MSKKNDVCIEEQPGWYNGQFLDEVGFCCDFICRHPMVCVGGKFFSKEGRIHDENGIKKEIYEMLRPFLKVGLAKKCSNLLEMLRMEAYKDNLPVHEDRLHVANGTLFVRGEFSEHKEFCRNRLPVKYNPDAPQPVTWLHFLSELLEDEDILTLQEYLGYCLLPVTKAQKMLLMVGKGGEGKSRVGLIFREIFGGSMNTGSLQKVETNRFARADLEYKLVLVDDDMRMEALPSTNNIKSIVTLEDRMDIERKGSQSVQGTLYVRFACFGNGSLQALYDKSDGFYRRQLLLTTRDKADGREDDPFLIDKMKQEKEGIFLWGLEGLHRLMANRFRFTISERAAANLEEAREKGNNILVFLKSEGYFAITPGARCRSKDFYNVYERWCQDNLEKPLAAKTFLHYLKEHQQALGVVYDEKCVGTSRGFHNVCLTPFVPVNGDDPDLPWH